MNEMTYIDYLENMDAKNLTTTNEEWQASGYIMSKVAFDNNQIIVCK